MKYTILAIFLFLSISKSVGSNNDLLQKPVTLNVQQKSLQDILLLISQQTGAVFSYNPQEVDTLRTTSLKVKEKPLELVLKQLLEPSIIFKQHGIHIILTPSGTLPDQNSETTKNSRLNLLKTRDSVLFSKKMPPFISGSTDLVCHSSVNSKNDEQMKKQITALLLTLATIATVNEVTAQPEAKNQKPFQATFVHPLGTDGTNSSKHSYNTSINIIGGITGGLHGFELGGVFNKNSGSTRGAQFAGVFNLTQDVEGVQFAGVFNASNSANKVAQFAGVANAVKSGETAAQFAGIANASKNVTSQIAGVVNISDTVICQAAGIVNIAHKSKVQVGMVNISDDAEIMIGLVNIAKNGFKEIEIAGGEFLQATASFRSGTKRFYGIVSLSYNFDDEFFGYGVGAGTTYGFGSKIGMNLEAMHYSLATKKFEQKKYNGLTQLRPVFYYELAKHCKLFAGPVVNLYVSNNTAENQLQISAPYTIWDDVSTDGKTKVEAWVGFTAGIRF